MRNRLLLALAFVLSAVPAFAQPTAGAPFIFGQYQWFDANGAVLNGGKICTYAAGSATPHSTWSDSGLTVLNANPVILSAAGRASIYLDGTNYKITVLTAGTTNDCSTGSTVYTQDNVEDLANVFFNTTRTANTVYAGPTSGAAAAPTFRALVAADVPAAPWTTITTTSTGTQDNFAPGLSNNTIIRCNNATLLTIDGFSGGVSGQRIMLVSIGAGEVDFANQAAGSTAANRLINFVTSGITPLAAGIGTAEYEYDGTTLRWRLIEHQQGGWITPTFSAGRFTASSSTWTVASAQNEQFYLNGRQLTVQLALPGTSVGGTPATLRYTLPNSYTTITAFGVPQATVLYSDNGGAYSAGGVAEPFYSTLVYFYKATYSGTWSASTTATAINVTFVTQLN